jgi:hypothetical protein
MRVEGRDGVVANTGINPVRWGIAAYQDFGVVRQRGSQSGDQCCRRSRILRHERMTVPAASSSSAIYPRIQEPGLRVFHSSCGVSVIL